MKTAADRLAEEITQLASPHNEVRRRTPDNKIAVTSPQAVLLSRSRQKKKDELLSLLDPTLLADD